MKLSTPHSIANHYKLENVKLEPIFLKILNLTFNILTRKIFSFVKILLYRNELLLEVWSRVIPRWNGFAKVEEIIDDPITINGYHVTHATESCVLLFAFLRVKHGREPLQRKPRTHSLIYEITINNSQLYIMKKNI